MIRFHMEWQDAPGVRDVVLARSWCRLVIETDGRLVTEAIHGPSESLRGGVYGSAFPLCRWLVENWWFLLNEAYRFPARFSSSELARVPRDREWVQRHSLLAAQEGYALPDLTLFRDEQRVIARWMPDDRGVTHPPLRFVGEGETQINVADAERGVAEAIQAVVDRLDGIDVPEVAALREDWAAIEGATEQERRLCEWSARLGLDPYDGEELTDDMEKALRESVAALDASIRHDFLDAAQPQTLPRDLDWLHEAEALAADAGAGRSRKEVSCNNGSPTAHGFGYECAMALRRSLLPNLHDPIGDDDLAQLLVRLGWARCPSRTLDIEPESPLEAALAQSSKGAPVAIVGDAGPDANRFRIARSAFLHHFAPSGSAPSGSAPSGRTHRRLVTEAHTWEQRASRAFAAEFLAPAAGLARGLGRKAAPRQTDELAQRYGVSSEAIRRQIENHRLAWLSCS